MDKTMVSNERKLNCKTPITVLALIALIFAVFNSLTYFAYDTYYEINGVDVQEIIFSFPSIFGLISWVLMLAPKVLLVLYVFKFSQECKGAVIVPAIFACVAVNYLWDFIISFLGTGFAFIIYFITGVIMTIVFALATISALKGIPKKILIIIPIALDLILTLSNITHIKFYDIMGIAESAWFVASITFGVALLLLCLKNRIPSVLAARKTKTEEMKPEQALKQLKEKFDLGILTEEEYQAQRAEIISKL